LRKAVSVPKASRNAHSKDQTYADWLDDSAAAKALGDRSVVPERAVRLALRNAADVADGAVELEAPQAPNERLQVIRAIASAKPLCARRCSTEHRPSGNY